MKSGLLTIEPSVDLSQIRQEWSELLLPDSPHTFFLTPDWQFLWWDFFSSRLESSGVRYYPITLREDNRLVGLAHLLIQGPGEGESAPELHLAGGEEIADFLDYTAAPGYESRVASAILDHIESLDWGRFVLRNLRSDSNSLVHLLPEAEKRGYKTSVEQEDTSPRIELPESWEAYQGSLSKKDRHELRRKLRRLHGAGQVAWYYTTSPDNPKRGAEGPDNNADVSDFIRLHKQSAEEKATFMNAEMEGWFRRLVDHFGPSGKLKLYFLEIDGVRTSTIILFDHAGEFLLYNSGYDPEFSRQSVGLALKAYAIYDAIALERKGFDFLQGSESYKYDLGGADVPISTLTIRK